MGYKLSQKGIELMNKQRREKRWSKYDNDLLDAANVSRSSLQRFWGVVNGGVSEDMFITICQAAGLDDVLNRWDELAEEINRDSTYPNELTIDNMNIVGTADNELAFCSTVPELSSQTHSVFSEQKFALRIDFQVNLTQEKKDLTEYILKGFEKNLLDSYIDLSINSNSITASETFQYDCDITISGVVPSDKESKVNKLIKELKHHTGLNDEDIQCQVP